jgi:hypothetical protein
MQDSNGICNTFNSDSNRFTRPCRAHQETFNHSCYSDDWFAGTDNEVWFDIGPMAWKLDGGFSKGSTRTIDLDVTRPATDPLYVDDIVEARLEKKGIHGWTDAPDSVIDPLLPSGKISQADLVAVYQKQVNVARCGVDQASSALLSVNHIIDEQDKAILAANQVLSQAEDAIKTVPATIANLNNRIVDTQVHLVNTAQRIIGKVPVPGICTKKSASPVFPTLAFK